MNNGIVKWLNADKGFGLITGKMATIYLHIFQLFKQMDLKL